MRKKLIIVLAVALLIVGANFVLRETEPNEPFLGDIGNIADSGEQGEENSQSINDSSNESPESLLYSGRPLGEIRIGERFSGGDEIIALQQKNLAEHIAEIESNPNNVDAWVGVGLIKKFFNDYEGARDVWEYTARRFPNHPINFANLGNLYGFYLTDNQKAINNYKRAIALVPFEPAFYLSLAEFYRDVTKERTKVIETIEEGIEFIPEDINLPLFLAAYYRSLGEAQNAVTYFERVLELSPGHPGVQKAIDDLKNNI